MQALNKVDDAEMERIRMENAPTEESVEYVETKEDEPRIITSGQSAAIEMSCTPSEMAESVYVQPMDEAEIVIAKKQNQQSLWASALIRQGTLKVGKK